MKKALLVVGLVAVGVAISRLPEEKREHLSKVAQTIMERCPCHKIMSGVVQIQRQDDEILSLLRALDERVTAMDANLSRQSR